MTYNGWTNHATWNANLWNDGLFDDLASDLCRSCASKDEAVKGLEAEIENHFASMLDEIELIRSNGHLFDILRSGIDDINCLEIAESIIDDFWTDEEETDDDQE